MILGWMLTIVSLLVLEDRGIVIELGVGETNRKLSLLTLLFHLRIAEWHSDSKSHSRGTEMMEEFPFLLFFDGSSCA